MDLQKRRKLLLEAEVKYYVYQVIQACLYLHSNQIVHRDLKIGNLFIDNMKIKVGDFGLSTKIEQGERKKTICGTPNYMAPEVLDNSNGHSYEVDIWSIGIILYTLLVGRPPFETQDVKTTYQRIKQNQYTFPKESPISDDAKRLIVSILNPIPEQRPKLNQILQHNFFTFSSIPKYLPVSALTVPPVKLQQQPTIVAPLPLSDSTNIVSQRQQPSQPTTQYIPTTTTSTYHHQSPSKYKQSPSKKIQQLHPQQQQQQQRTLSPRSQQKLEEVEKDDFHFRKLRKLEKMKENDMMANILKNKMTTTGVTSTSTLPAPTLDTNNNNNNNEHKDKVKELEAKIANNYITEPFNGGQPGMMPSSLVYVAQYSDHSNKYGLGYMLSNNTVGAYFNDSTKIICLVSTGIAHYMEHAKGTEGDGRRIVNVNETHPHDTQKKVSLLKFFSNHFGLQLLSEQQQQIVDGSSTSSTAPMQSCPVYVKKWIKANKGIAFRLSDNTIQMNFVDKSMIVITKDQMVTYVGSDETTIKTDRLANFVAAQDAKVVSRIRYTKEIIVSLYHKKPDDML
ncbi:hypothetical protein SAMD00019534_032340 [Acytostelium subglobosum LB1]|uniref:hypothetical protein n=1 Tax=Acytostelium subglobosum LB1 TaxID=1410327 RepID=UPI00064504E6|nr:hypothetical protein SAMD00019534_032340 [Acytostelium subglobosum LB1]GAM20059.1 hypothetical protein SAMD00019534_032340 [Acytostelium subglobosum LB1]|eukprot:XP_012756821.1 hypothetical protein SAMD00019534_032340 [Acytostelium subglobosum LB1]